MLKIRMICRVGIMDSDEKVFIMEELPRVNGKRKQRVVWRCPFYQVWVSMLYRCYSEKHLARQPTYIGCLVCEEWLRFSNFKAWMEKQDWEGKELDKDILFRGNKIYSPEVCVFVTRQVNGFIVDSGAIRGDWPVGVKLDKRRNKFTAHCKFEGKQIHLGSYATPDEAHEAWLAYKLTLAYKLAEQQTDNRVAIALVDRYINYG